MTHLTAAPLALRGGSIEERRLTQYALIYRIVDVEASNRHRPQHVEYLRSLLREGKIVDGMKFPDYYEGCVQGVLVCEAASKAEVAAWFDRDPAVSSGARTYEVREFERMTIKA